MILKFYAQLPANGVPNTPTANSAQISKNAIAIAMIHNHLLFSLLVFPITKLMAKPTLGHG